METTFRQLKEAGACTDRYRHLAKQLGGIIKYGRDTPITALQILEHNGMEDLWWAWPLFDQAKADRIGRIFACDCAERLLHIANDERSTRIVEVARRYVTGEATDDELAAAKDVAKGVARATVWDTPRDAVKTASWAAPWAAPWAAARAASWVAPGDDEAGWQASHIRSLLEQEIP